MTTRIHTQVKLSGLSCEVNIETETTAEALVELQKLTSGNPALASVDPNVQAASQAAPAATQTAQQPPSVTASAPPAAATASATPTPTPSNTPAPTTTAAAPAPSSGESLVEKATELLGREGGTEYLQWALQQVGGATVGTTPPEKQAELLQHIKTGLGE